MKKMRASRMNEEQFQKKMQKNKAGREISGFIL